MFGTALTILQHWDENKKVVAEPVKDVTTKASDFLHKKADETSEFIKTGYRNSVNDATEWLASRAGWAGDGIRKIGSGYADIGGAVLSMLDPVSYAMDIGGDIIYDAGAGTVNKVDAVAGILQGKDIEANAKKFGAEWLNSNLVGAQVALTALPGGHIASKAAKVPLKAARKELKTALKTVPKGSVEAKAIKHDIHVNKVKTSVASKVARVSGITAKEKSRDEINSLRKKLPLERRGIRTPNKIWADDHSLNQERLFEPVKQGGEEVWNRNNLRRR